MGKLFSVAWQDQIRNDACYEKDNKDFKFLAFLIVTAIN